MKRRILAAIIAAVLAFILIGYVARCESQKDAGASDENPKFTIDVIETIEK